MSEHDAPFASQKLTCPGVTAPVAELTVAVRVSRLPWITVVTDWPDSVMVSVVVVAAGVAPYVGSKNRVEAISPRERPGMSLQHSAADRVIMKSRKLRKGIKILQVCIALPQVTSGSYKDAKLHPRAMLLTTLFAGSFISHVVRSRLNVGNAGWIRSKVFGDGCCNGPNKDCSKERKSHRRWIAAPLRL